MARKLQPIEINIKYNKLKIVKDLGQIKLKDKNRRMCLAECECGSIKVMRHNQITSGLSKSCGCLQKNFAKTGMARFKHGDTGTRFYGIWCGMINRSKKSSQEKYYKSYLRLNIKHEKNWDSYEIFKKDMYQQYVEHVNKYGEKQTTLDRINTYGDYCKENCRWATYKEQQNNRTNNIIKTYGTN